VKTDRTLASKSAGLGAGFLHGYIYCYGICRSTARGWWLL